MADEKVCAAAECGKRVRSKGLCSAHYRRHLRHGSHEAGRFASGAPLAWLLAKRDHAGDGCLIWPFTRLNNGYGSVRKDGRVQVASRVMCEEVNGPPPETWYQAAHGCGRGHLACVHPGHLSWKTPVDNAGDKVTHGTNKTGSANANSKLSEDQVAHVREMIGRCTQRSLARKFGVSQPLISMIQHGQTRAQATP